MLSLLGVGVRFSFLLLLFFWGVVVVVCLLLFACFCCCCCWSCCWFLVCGVCFVCLFVCFLGEGLPACLFVPVFLSLSEQKTYLVYFMPWSLFKITRYALIENW